MSTIISGNGSLVEDNPRFSKPIRILAQFVSWVFHPLFIPLYVTLFLAYVHPYAFVALSEKGKMFKLIFVFVNTALFPGIAVFLMWRLKLIKSFYLKTQKERIIPYAAAMIFYFWAWYVSRSLQDNEQVFIDFMFGSFFTVIAAWMANILYKISMHALAMGAMVVFVIWVSFSGDGSSGIYPAVVLLIAGTVCTARMIVSDHRPFDIYSGFLIGMVCQLASLLF